MYRHSGCSALPDIRDDAAETIGGYWLIKLLSIDEDREIDEDDRGLLKYKLLNEWVDGLWDNPDNKLENYLDDELKAWAVANV